LVLEAPLYSVDRSSSRQIKV